MVRVGPYHDVDIVMMCGDLTGKAIAPIVRRKPNEWVYLGAREEVFHSAEQVERKIEEIRNQGYYTCEVTSQEVEELRADDKRVHQLFLNLMKETLIRWVGMAKEKIPKNIMVIMNPGNDDERVIDEVLENDDRIIYPLGKVVELSNRHQLISCEWVNPTPWKNTPRECSEEALAERLETEFGRLGSYQNTVCNFHAPPYGTHLDIAAKLDEKLRPVMSWGRPVTENVGSKAVRKVLEEKQPLLSLHGHIHEAAGFQYLGRTLCLNPGSDYQAGIVKGSIVDLPDDGGKINFWQVDS
jgi:Icc-related predicted phosphoesterase